MNKKKIINIATAMFVLVIFTIAVAPQILAQEIIDIEKNKIDNKAQISETTINSISKKKTNESSLNFVLEIPCAIDKTQIILPTRINNESTGPYKEKCDSLAYFDNDTKIKHLKENEGYYLNIKITNDYVANKKNYDIKEIIINFYKENDTEYCYSKKILKETQEPDLFSTKIYTPNDIYENSMSEFIEFCGINTPILFKISVTTETQKITDLQNIGNIQKIIVDSVAFEKQNINKNTNILEKKQTKEIGKLEIKDTEIFITTDNSMKKIESFENIVAEKKINEKKIISNVVLETKNNVPEYVFQIKIPKKLLWIIPIGEKIVEKRIPAIKNLKE